MLRALVRRLDAYLRQRYGVFDFCDDPDCILRLQVAPAPHKLTLDDVTVAAGQSVLMLHLRNESLPMAPADGPDLAWVNGMLRSLLRSFGFVAREMKTNPKLADVRAVGGTTVLLYSGLHESAARVMPRFGFTVFPYTSPLGGFGEFWENFYSWMLIWTYNPSSLRFRRLLRLRRSEFWISASEFKRRFGKSIIGS